MASLTIRNLEDEIKALLRLRAASHGCSIAQEAHDILRQALQDPPSATGLAFALKIHQRFAGVHVDELPIPKRRPVRASAIA